MRVYDTSFVFIDDVPDDEAHILAHTVLKDSPGASSYIADEIDGVPLVHVLTRQSDGTIRRTDFRGEEIPPGLLSSLGLR